jgi:hypothetical protein
MKTINYVIKSTTIRSDHDVSLILLRSRLPANQQTFHSDSRIRQYLIDHPELDILMSRDKFLSITTHLVVISSRY